MVKKYCVVEYYPDSKGSKPVEIVPSIWIDFEKKFVYWPPLKKSAIIKAVKKAEQHPYNNWTIFQYNRVLKEYGNKHFLIVSDNLLKVANCAFVSVHQIHSWKHRKD